MESVGCPYRQALKTYDRSVWKWANNRALLSLRDFERGVYSQGIWLSLVGFLARARRQAGTPVDVSMGVSYLLLLRSCGDGHPRVSLYQTLRNEEGLVRHHGVRCFLSTADQGCSRLCHSPCEGNAISRTFTQGPYATLLPSGRNLSHHGKGELVMRTIRACDYMDL